MSNESSEKSKDLVEKLEQEFKYYKENSNYEKAIEIAEKLSFEYSCFKYRFELAELYNELKLYNKTIDFVNSWMAESDDLLKYALVEWPEPIIELAKAHAAVGSVDFAIKKLTQVINTVNDIIKNSSDVSDIESKKVLLAVAKTEMGKIYYNQKNFTQAHNCFKSALDTGMYSEALYYIAHMCYKGEGFEKDIPSAIAGYLYLSDAEISNKSDNYDESEICILNSIYKLGMIYATEKEYIDKDKATLYLNKAKAMGYKITDEKINLILSKIDNNTHITNESSSDGCYVATCVYGSYDCPQVWTLRRFRDNVLKYYIFGRLFIKIYYAISPLAVKIFGKYKWFNSIFKPVLNRIISKLNDIGVENTPYNDINN